MSGRDLRIVPYNGNRAYKYYLDGYKVNGKRKRLFFKDVAAANRKLTELAKRQKKEGQDGLDISLESRYCPTTVATTEPETSFPITRQTKPYGELRSSGQERMGNHL